MLFRKKEIATLIGMERCFQLLHLYRQFKQLLKSVLLFSQTAFLPGRFLLPGSQSLYGILKLRNRRDVLSGQKQILILELFHFPDILPVFPRLTVRSFFQFSSPIQAGKVSLL